MSGALRAGRLFLWEAKNAPKMVKLPEAVNKASVGPDHVLAIGESG